MHQIWKRTDLPRFPKWQFLTPPVAVKLVAILLMMSWGSPQYMYMKRQLQLENVQNQ